MLDVGIMIEGQNGLNWSRWKNLVLAVEELGFEGLYRSDHFTNSNPPDKDSLELWISLTWLVSNTKRIKFGPLVSPISFRNPAITARMAAGVDDLSGGRLVLGLGAGWQEREHNNFGFSLLDTPARFDRFEEGIQVIQQLLKSESPIDFSGTYFELHEAILLPRPERPGGPPILLGGNGRKRTLPLVAKYADEWNALFITAEAFQTLNNALDQLLSEQKRKPGDVKRSLMTGCVVGMSESDVEGRVARRTSGKRSTAQLREHGLIVGTPPQIAAQLEQLSSAGVQKVMLQWLELEDLENLKLLASELF